MTANTTTLTIHNHKWRIERSKETKPVYWQSKELDKLPKYHKANLGTTVIVRGRKSYLTDSQGNLLLKNTKSVGKPKYWVLNGQELYSGNLHRRSRAALTYKYHEYLTPYIKEAFKEPIVLEEGEYVEIKVRIYEHLRPAMPDASNLWLWVKWFEDSLQEAGILPDDSRKYVKSSGGIELYEPKLGDNEKIQFIVSIKDIKSMDGYGI